jgi:hypothetical protein
MKRNKEEGSRLSEIRDGVRVCHESNEGERERREYVSEREREREPGTAQQEPRVTRVGE